MKARLVFGLPIYSRSYPNTSLAFMESLIDGAHAWRFHIAGCTEARRAAEDSEPLDNFGVLSVVQNF